MNSHNRQDTSDVQRFLNSLLDNHPICKKLCTVLFKWFPLAKRFWYWFKYHLFVVYVNKYYLFIYLFIIIKLTTSNNFCLLFKSGVGGRGKWMFVFLGQFWFHFIPNSLKVLGFFGGGWVFLLLSNNECTMQETGSLSLRPWSEAIHTLLCLSSQIPSGDH